MARQLHDVETLSSQRAAGTDAGVKFLSAERRHGTEEVVPVAQSHSHGAFTRFQPHLLRL
jgi:hypothetical protein